MITVLQVISAVILTVLVLLQERGSGLGALGGGGAAAPYQTKRGIGKVMFWATIVVAMLFAVFSVLNLAH